MDLWVVHLEGELPTHVGHLPEPARPQVGVQEPVERHEEQLLRVLEPWAHLHRHVQYPPPVVDVRAQLLEVLQTGVEQVGQEGEPLPPAERHRAQLLSELLP